MADIALLVVEEFERRKVLEKEKQGEGVDPGTCLWILVRGVKDLALPEERVEGFEFAKRILEPKSPAGLAAIDGLFSA